MSLRLYYYFVHLVQHIVWLFELVIFVYLYIVSTIDTEIFIYLDLFLHSLLLLAQLFHLQYFKNYYGLIAFL